MVVSEAQSGGVDQKQAEAPQAETNDTGFDNNRPNVVPKQYQLGTFVSDKDLNSAITVALGDKAFKELYDFSTLKGTLVGIKQGKLDGDTTGRYDPKSNTVTIDSRKLDRRNLTADLVNNIAHEVRHSWQRAMEITYGIGNFEAPIDSMTIRGKTQFHSWDGRINMDVPYAQQSHEIDAFFWGAKVMYETTGRIINVNGEVQ
jgi:hypothetical protein